MKKNILHLYKTKVADKDDYIKSLSENYNVAESTVITNWISRGVFPKRLIDSIHTFTVNYIVQQSKRALKKYDN